MYLLCPLIFNGGNMKGEELIGKYVTTKTTDEFLWGNNFLAQVTRVIANGMYNATTEDSIVEVKVFNSERNKKGIGYSQNSIKHVLLMADMPTYQPADVSQFVETEARPTMWQRIKRVFHIVRLYPFKFWVDTKYGYRCMQDEYLNGDPVIKPVTTEAEAEDYASIYA